MSRRSWSKEDLSKALKNSISIRQTLKKLGLKPAGGNYKTIEKYIKKYGLSTNPLLSQGWNKNLKFNPNPKLKLSEILKKDSDYQSYKLKKRLFKEKLKPKYCEECGWEKRSKDGRLPLELDHINGDSNDNRLENLKVLCPNFHSLKPNRGGRNIKKYK